jgi:hypothetical protein
VPTGVRAKQICSYILKKNKHDRELFKVFKQTKITCLVLLSDAGGEFKTTWLPDLYFLQQLISTITGRNLKKKTCFLVLLLAFVSETTAV